MHCPYAVALVEHVTVVAAASLFNGEDLAGFVAGTEELLLVDNTGYSRVFYLTTETFMCV